MIRRTLARRLAALALFGVLTVVHTWPLATDPVHLSRVDSNDAALNVWIVGWIAHSLPRAPLRLFEAPMFYPEAHTLAYADHLFVQGAIGAPLGWLGASPVFVFNLLLMLGLVLSGWAMYRVMAEWTGSESAGVIAGLLYGFNAHVLTRIPHLQAQHAEFLPIALLALDRVLARHAPRDKWLLAAAFVLQALCSNYFLVFTACVLGAAVAVRPADWLPTDRRGRIASLVIAGLVSAAAIAPFLWPYYQVSRDQGMARSLEEAALYSAHWQDYLATGGRLHYTLWSRPFVEGRTALFPGGVGVALAAVAVASGVAWRDRRARVAIPMAIVGFALSFGPAMPGYGWLHAHTIVGGLRNAARWGWLVIAAVAVLAGFGMVQLENLWRTRWPARHTAWAALVVLLGFAITIEALRAPMGFTTFRGVSRVYDAIGREPHPVLAEFPVYYGAAAFGNGPYLVNDTRFFEPLINGYSGFETRGFEERGRRLAGFPGPEAIGLLQDLGVTLVTVHTSAFTPERVSAADAVPDLERIADADGIRLYRLRPRSHARTN